MALDNLRARRSRQRWSHAALAAASTGLLLALSGLPATRWLGVRRQIERLHERVRRTPEAAFRDTGGGASAEVGAIEAVRASLRELIPDHIDRVRAFSALRRAAQAQGLELAGIQPGVETALAVDLGEETVQRVVFTLQGQAPLDGIGAFLADVRASGYPCDVESCAFARTHRGSDRFQFQIDLGLFQRVPAPLGEPSSEPDPSQLEE